MRSRYSTARIRAISGPVAEHAGPGGIQLVAPRRTECRLDSARRPFDGMAAKNVSTGTEWCVDIADMEEKGWAGRRLLQPN
ncbi:hypothetical protein GUJ93_ZPchr0003g18212 [Zizania palustris]|uniref:Uncharacterized protein n=1 Tax=Zizania palustris TaxID=103762 RepID=A0A8J5SC66_ZIZPA|nr:hypothetical protein GUJ93_ZPchr0003g18212 [Zizania palustris]